MKLRVRAERLPLRQSLHIAGHRFDDAESLVVELAERDLIGRGEASGLYYEGETADSMASALESVRSRIESLRPDEPLQHLLPAGGARNALDCAWWELQSRLRQQPVWQLAGLEAPRPTLTSRTLYAAAPAAMAEAARQLAEAPLLKLKLLGDEADARRVEAVREARPDARLIVDANQGLGVAGYRALAPALAAAGVELIEQPFPVGHDDWLDRLPRPVPVAADESAKTRADLAALRGRVDVINLKLDKAGGLSEALAMAEEARAMGFGLMVGCMCASSLAMAPALLLAQRCDWADIDGPLYLATDRSPALRYEAATVHWTPGVWGSE